MTEIKIMNTNYNVSKENESFKINGTCIYSDRVDSLSLEVYTLEGYYVGNVFYQELGDENNNVNYTVNKEYVNDVYALLQEIINEIKTELNQTK